MVVNERASDPELIGIARAGDRRISHLCGHVTGSISVFDVRLEQAQTHDRVHEADRN